MHSCISYIPPPAPNGWFLEHFFFYPPNFKLSFSSSFLGISAQLLNSYFKTPAGLSHPQFQPRNWILPVFWWYRNRLQYRRPGFDPWVGKIPWRRAWQPTPVFLSGESQGHRSLAGYGPWGCKESDTTDKTCTQSAALLSYV